MKLMRIPDYRLPLSMMLGEQSGQMIEMGLPACDFIDPRLHQPAIISLDMDLIGRAQKLLCGQIKKSSMYAGERLDVSAQM